MNLDAHKIGGFYKTTVNWKCMIHFALWTCRRSFRNVSVGLRPERPCQNMYFLLGLYWVHIEKRRNHTMYVFTIVFTNHLLLHHFLFPSFLQPTEQIKINICLDWAVEQVHKKWLSISTVENQYEELWKLHQKRTNGVVQFSAGMKCVHDQHKKMRGRLGHWSKFVIWLSLQAGKIYKLVRILTS